MTTREARTPASDRFVRTGIVCAPRLAMLSSLTYASPTLIDQSAIGAAEVFELEQPDRMLTSLIARALPPAPVSMVVNPGKWAVSMPHVTLVLDLPVPEALIVDRAALALAIDQLATRPGKNDGLCAAIRSTLYLLGSATPGVAKTYAAPIVGAAGRILGWRVLPPTRLLASALLRIVDNLEAEEAGLPVGWPSDAPSAWAEWKREVRIDARLPEPTRARPAPARVHARTLRCVRTLSAPRPPAHVCVCWQLKSVAHPRVCIGLERLDDLDELVIRAFEESSINTLTALVNRAARVFAIGIFDPCPTVADRVASWLEEELLATVHAAVTLEPMPTGTPEPPTQLATPTNSPRARAPLVGPPRLVLTPQPAKQLRPTSHPEPVAARAPCTPPPPVLDAPDTPAAFSMRSLERWRITGLKTKATSGATKTIVKPRLTPPRAIVKSDLPKPTATSVHVEPPAEGPTPMDALSRHDAAFTLLSISGPCAAVGVDRATGDAAADPAHVSIRLRGVLSPSSVIATSTVEDAPTSMLTMIKVAASVEAAVECHAPTMPVKRDAEGSLWV